MHGTGLPSEGDDAATRSAGWRPLHEAGAAAGSTAAGSIEARADGTVAETGTTVVALTAADAVVLAADRRASVGGGRFVTGKRVQKVEAVHPTAATACSGTVGHIQRFNAALDAEASLYETRRGEPTSLPALATLAGNALRSAPLGVQALLAGVDADGPRVYGLDGGGGVLPDEYAAGGSGMQVAYGVLERRYEPGASVADARAVAARAVDAASERDTASGNGLAVAVVTDDGVAVEEFDDPDDAVGAAGVDRDPGDGASPGGSDGGNGEVA